MGWREGESEIDHTGEQKKKLELAEQFKNNNRYKLKESTEYVAGEGNYRYETDSRGRIVKCSGTLELHDETSRNNYAQRKAGGENRHTKENGEETADDGGHLIARRFGGSPEIDNIVAMDSGLNQHEYKTMENDWASRLEEKTESGDSKYKVDVDIRCKYADKNLETGERDSKRPTDIFVYSKVTDTETGEVVDRTIYHYKNEHEDNTTTRSLKKED